MICDYVDCENDATKSFIEIKAHDKTYVHPWDLCDAHIKEIRPLILEHGDKIINEKDLS